MRDISDTQAQARIAASYLYRYLELDAETQLIDWQLMDGGEGIARLRKLATLLVSGNIGDGPDKLVAAGKKFKVYEARSHHLYGLIKISRERAPCWVSQNQYVSVQNPIFMAMQALEERCDKLAAPLKTLVEDELVPELMRLCRRSEDMDRDACTEVVGGVYVEDEFEAAYEKEESA
jgi:hypothetical protein